MLTLPTFDGDPLEIIIDVEYWKQRSLEDIHKAKKNKEYLDNLFSPQAPSPWVLEDRVVRQMLYATFPGELLYQDGSKIK